MRLKLTSIPAPIRNSRMEYWQTRKMNKNTVHEELPLHEDRITELQRRVDLMLPTDSGELPGDDLRTLD